MRASLDLYNCGPFMCGAVQIIKVSGGLQLAVQNFSLQYYILHFEQAKLLADILKTFSFFFPEIISSLDISLGKFGRWQVDDIFLTFPRK